MAAKILKKLERVWRRDNAALNCSRYGTEVNRFNRHLELTKTRYHRNMVREMRIPQSFVELHEENPT